MPVMDKNWQNTAKEISKAIAKAWLDNDFRTKLLEEPKATLEGEGISFAPGISVRVDQDTFSWKIEPPSSSSLDAVITVPVPPRPADVKTTELEQWIKGETEERPCCLPIST